MRTQIHAAHVNCPADFLQRAQSEIGKILRPFEDRIISLDVYLQDINGPRKGIDKRCLIEARLSGQGPVAACHESSSWSEVVLTAGHKLRRLIASKVKRRLDRKSKIPLRESVALKWA